MNKAIAGCVLGVCCLAAQAQELEEAQPRTRSGATVARQAELDAEAQRRFGVFANVDALPTYPTRRSSLGAPARLAPPSLPSPSLPAVGRNGFGLELPSPALRSPGASLRLSAPSPFGGPSFSSTLPGFGVATPAFDPNAALGQLPSLPSLGGLPGASGLFGSKRGRHSSMSLPFLDSKSAGDLTYKIEAVKIAETALKELNGAPPGAAGGFKMMKFLYKLIKRVRPRQKGMVVKLLVLITVPYFATLAVSWFTGLTTAMDLTWPGAKKGIVKVLELILKKYGRIGGAANIQSYAAQLS
ncbi:MAG: hypothetical protein KDD82_08175, partial [Planctomycetes bacterium]|nr:hypothetical protein [Planctomycetota bacterium]